MDPFNDGNQAWDLATVGMVTKYTDLSRVEARLDPNLAVPKMPTNSHTAQPHVSHPSSGNPNLGQLQSVPCYRNIIPSHSPWPTDGTMAGWPEGRMGRQ